MNMKKLISLALAMVMMLAMAVPAFAAGEGSITITNATAGYDYTIYRIFALSYNTETKSYSYTVMDDWKKFVAKETTDAETGVVTPAGAGADYVNIDAQGYVTWATGKSAAEFAKAAQKYAADNNVPNQGTQNATGTTVTFTGLDLGYYLVDSSMGALCSLNSTDPNVEIEEKNEIPANDKKVEEDSLAGTDNAWGEANDADIGQTVNFQSTITAEEGAQNYIFHDTMSKGLTFNGVDSVSVKLNDVTVESGYTVYAGNIDGCDKNCTFHVVFDQAFCNTLKDNDKIVISYSATLNENAVVGVEGNPNESKISYGEDGQHETLPSKTTTYTWDMDVVKYTEVNGKKVVLSGAKFTLSKSEDGSNPIKFTKTAENVYKVDPNGEITEIETDATGTFKIVGLDADTYYLTETQAPAGYNKLTGPQKVVIETTEGTDSVTNLPTLEYTTVKAEVENKTGSELPSTGGMGTTMLYAAGSLMVAAAVVLLIVKRRMNAAE